MAFTTYGTVRGATTASLRDRFERLVADLKDARAKRRVYRTTVNELSVLSDRDLADLGVSRSEIRAIATKAAYGA